MKSLPVAALAVAIGGAHAFSAPPPAAPPAGTPARTEGTTASEADTAKWLDQLAKAEDAVKKARTGNNLAAVDAIRDAASSDQKAVSLWIDCVHQADFKEKDKKDADFRAWREAQGKRLSDPGAAAALRLHLQYLLLTLRASNVKTEPEQVDVLTAAVQFLEDLIKADKDTLRNRQVLDASVLATPIARRFKLDSTVKPSIPWCLQPGDVAGIYETAVLPYLRSHKDATRLQSAWNRRLQQEAALVSAQDSEFQSRLFNEVTKPRLDWAMARDLFEAGQTAMASKMLQLIQQNPAHKDAPQWVGELRGLLGDRTTPDAGTVPPPGSPPRPETAPAPTAAPESADSTPPPEPAALAPPATPPGREPPPGKTPPGRTSPPQFPPNLPR